MSLPTLTTNRSCPDDLVRYGLIWGVWTIVALFFSTQVYLMNYAEKQPIRYTAELSRASVGLLSLGTRDAARPLACAALPHRPQQLVDEEQRFISLFSRCL